MKAVAVGGDRFAYLAAEAAAEEDSVLASASTGTTDVREKEVVRTRTCARISSLFIAALRVPSGATRPRRSPSRTERADL